MHIYYCVSKAEGFGNFNIWNNRFWYIVVVIWNEFLNEIKYKFATEQKYDYSKCVNVVSYNKKSSYIIFQTEMFCKDYGDL